MYCNNATFQIRQDEISHMNSYAQRRQAALEFHKEEYERAHPFGSPPHSMRALEEGEGEDEIDGYPSSALATYTSPTKTSVSKC